MYKFILILLSPFFIVSVFLAVLQKKYPPNPYECILIYAKPGAGKTLDSSKYAIEYLVKGWNVYTNEAMNIKGVRQFDIKNFGKKPEPKSVMIIDEAGIVFSNRDFKSFSKTQRKFAKLYRHCQCSLIFYSQSNDIDKQLRDICSSEYILYKYFGYFTVKRKLKKQLDILPKEQVQSADQQLINYLEFESIFTQGALQIYYQPKYYKYVDTYNTPPEIDLMPYNTLNGIDVLQGKVKKKKKGNKKAHSYEEKILETKLQ